MSDESSTASGTPQPTPEEVQQSRRDFLMGLGRWSKIVIGAALFGGLAGGAQAGAWVNRRGGWINGGGGWINSSGWANGGSAWVNGGGGSWANARGGGGGWVNGRGGGGSWINRR